MIASKSALSQARARLGPEPLQHLFATVARPMATAQTRGAFWHGRRLVALDATMLDVADTPANGNALGRPTGVRGQSAYPQVRVLALVETGTHAVFGAAFGSYYEAEVGLAEPLLPQLTADMLCLCDRGFWGYDFWQKASATGAALVWRGKANLRLAREREDLPDGSYLSRIYRGRDWKAKRNGQTVRVVDYRLDGVPGAEPLYRVITNLLDPAQASAEELAMLYAERWEQENLFDEIKTHLRGAQIVLRSQTPDLVRQEVWGLLLAHYAVRGLMHEAALTGDVDPDRLSFVHAVRVVRRSLPQWAAFSPSPPCRPAPDAAPRTARRTAARASVPQHATRRETPDQQVPLTAQAPKSSGPGQNHYPAALGKS